MLTSFEDLLYGENVVSRYSFFDTYCLPSQTENNELKEECGMLIEAQLDEYISY